MTTGPDHLSEYQNQLGAILLAYLRAAEEGRPLDREEWLRRHPDFVAELEQFLQDQDHFEHWDHLLRDAARRDANAGELRSHSLARQGPQVPAAPTRPDPGRIDDRLTLSLGPSSGADGAPSTEADEFPPSAFRAQPTLFDWKTTANGVGMCDVPGYEVFEELGRGGMGVVYRARQVQANRIVALKIIRGGSQAGPTDKARFHREAETLARLQHPNVVQIYEVGEHRGIPFFSLEYCEGGSLAGRLDGTPWPSAKAAQVVERLAQAVQAAHEHQIIHRDLKPANVLLRAGRNAEVLAEALRVTDFGLAKLVDRDSHSQSNVVVGTPSYMAPEQAAGKYGEIGAAADVYALGAILYELLTGRPPFKAETPLHTVMQVMGGEVVAPSRLQPRTPRDLETICLKCLQKDPRKRYPSASALAEDLQRFLDDEPIRARPVGLLERGLKWVKRRPALATLVAIALLAVVVAAGLIGWMNVYLTDQLVEERRTVSALKEEEHRQQQRASLRDVAQKLLAQGGSALERADQLAKKGEFAGARLEYEKARDRFREVAAQTAAETTLAELHREAERQRDRAARGARARAGITEFEELRDLALFHLTRFSGRDPAADLDDAKARTRQALEVFDVAVTEERGPVLDEQFLTPEEITRIRRSCYELLVMLASATATAPPGKDAPGRAKLHEAIAILDRAARLGVRTRAFHTRKGRYLKQLGETVEADREAGRGGDVEPRTALDHFLLGEDHYAEGRYAEAIRHFDAVLLDEPGHFWGRYYKALCHLRVAGWNPLQSGLLSLHVHDAHAALTVCIAKRPDFVWSYLLRGFVNGQLGAFAAAESDFATALQQRELNRLEQYALFVNRGAMRARRKDRRTDAVRDLTAATRLQPEQYHAHLNLARVYQLLAKLAEAQASYNRAVQSANGQPEPFRLRADFRVQQNNVRGALDDLDVAIRLEKDRRSARLARDLAEKARLLQEIGQLDRALETCQEATKVNRDFTLVHYLHGQLLLKMDRPKEALPWLSLYIYATESPEPRAYLLRGMVYARQGEKAKALEDFNRAVVLAPEGPDAYLHRGETLMKDQAYVLAKRDFDRAIHLKSDYAEAYNARALLQVGRNEFNYQLGVEDAAAAVRHNPRNSLVAYNAARIVSLAVIRARTDARGQRLEPQYRRQAVELLAKALQLLPEDQRQAFWRDRVLKEKETVFQPVQDSPEFAELGRRYGQAVGVRQ